MRGGLGGGQEVGSRTIEGPGSGRYYVSIQDACQFLNTSKDTLRRLLKRFPQVKVVKVGTSTQFVWRDVVWLAWTLEMERETNLRAKEKPPPGKNSGDAPKR